MRALTLLAGIIAGLASLHWLAGCSNDLSSSLSKPGGAAIKTSATSPLLVVADSGNNRLTQMRDMTGAGWQSYGPAGKYTAPASVAVDPGGKIYALDTQGTRLTRIDNITGAGWTTYGSAGSGQGQFQGATGISVSQAILIADTGNSRIVRMDDITGAGWTAFSGTGATALHAPSAVTTDLAGRIYVLEPDALVRMDSIDGSGWTSFGSAGSGQDQFQGAAGIALDIAGHIYIADRGNNRVVRLNDLSGAGWTSYAGVASPAALAVDTNSKITVVDANGNRLVQLTDISGASVTAFGATGSGSGLFSAPAGIALGYQSAVGSQ